MSKEEKNALYGAYKALNETPGVGPVLQLQPPEAATTVRVQDGTTLATDLDTPIELAARIPAARMCGAIEVRPILES